MAVTPTSLKAKLGAVNAGDSEAVFPFTKLLPKDASGEAQRLEELRKYARREGVDIKSLSETRPSTERPDSNPSSDSEKRHTDIKGKEAVLALYAYPTTANGHREYFPCVPQGRRDEIDRAREELRSMEEQLRSVTRQQMTAATESLESHSPPRTPKEHYIS